MRRRLLALVALALATQVVVACSTTTSAPTPSVVTPGPSSTSIEGSVPVQALGLNIPWAVGGPRIERDGTLKVNGGDWPTVPFRAVRLWDTRTAWLNLEPANGQFAFDQLDALVQKAQANGISDITLVLGGTPQWAASSVQDTDASWLGPGSASMPSDLAEWTGFVTTVAQRYAGRITSYEIGNEPNLRTFWSGTGEQYAQFVTSAASAIRAADPGATVLANAGLVRSKFDVPTLAKWLAPLGSAVSSHLLDALSLHYYPQAAQLDDASAILKAMKGSLAQNGAGALPVWMTEINVRNAPSLSSAAQAAAVQALGRTTVSAGFDRLYWYAWTDLGADDFVPFQPSSSGATALVALAGGTPAPASAPVAGPTVPAPEPPTATPAETPASAPAVSEPAPEQTPDGTAETSG